MNYDFIEIGTSDFRTLIESANDTTVGISMEPLKFYLDRLPNKKNVIKVNYALSTEDGNVDIFYISPDTIKKYGLPNWVRGCNSINVPHPTIKKLLGIRYDEIISKDSVPTISWKTFIKQYEIESIRILKVDTEGFDHVIIGEYYKCCIENPALLAQQIQFEKNELANHTELNVLIEKFKELGYIGNALPGDYILTKLN